MVLCPQDSEKEAGLSYGRVVPVVALASLIFFNIGMVSQFILLKVDGPAAVAGICLAVSILACVVWAWCGALLCRVFLQLFEFFFQHIFVTLYAVSRCASANKT